MVTLVIWVNGKVGDRLEGMTAGTDKEETKQLGLAAPKDQSYIEGRQIRKVIVVPERLVNIVCGLNQSWFLKRQFFELLFYPKTHQFRQF